MNCLKGPGSIENIKSAIKDLQLPPPEKKNFRPIELNSDLSQFFKKQITC